MSYPPVVGLPDQPLTTDALTTLVESTDKILAASPLIRSDVESPPLIVVATVHVTTDAGESQFIVGFDAADDHWVVLDELADGTFNTTTDALGVWAAQNSGLTADTLDACTGTDVAAPGLDMR